MSKEDVVTKLKSEGFNVELVNMIIMLKVPDDMTGKLAFIDKFRKRLTELGYDSSFGWQWHNDEEE
jgi:uncharacterized protein (UPF0335 family)